MKILRIQPATDTPDRYNYKVNYGVWDCIDSEKQVMNILPALSDSYISQFDAVFLPMYKRWGGYSKQLDRLKSLPVATVLFDNDSCYRSFNDPFYDGIDFVFYRIKDQDGKEPNNRSHELKWSVDADYFTPFYGGSRVSFNCTVNDDTYALRKEIAKHMSPTNYTGNDYVKHLQESAAAIHTNSEIAPIPRAKILEFAACGTEIISNRMDGMNDYFPDELITYFDTVQELLNIVRNFKPDIDKQKELRRIVEENHTDQIRAKELIQILKEHGL